MRAHTHDAATTIPCCSAKIVSAETQACKTQRARCMFVSMAKSHGQMKDAPALVPSNACARADGCHTQCTHSTLTRNPCASGGPEKTAMAPERPAHWPLTSKTRAASRRLNKTLSPRPTPSSSRCVALPPAACARHDRNTRVGRPAEPVAAAPRPRAVPCCCPSRRPAVRSSACC